MTLTRLPSWAEEHITFIESRRYVPFAWGANDCAIFWADSILAITGVDLAERWRGYSTAKAAESRVRKAGGLRAMALSVGLCERNKNFAQRGDGVLVILEGRETLGLVAADGHWCGPGGAGLVFRPLREALTSFQV